MGWVKLDAGFFLHPKALAAGRDGRDMFVAALCWSAQQMTDGRVPAHTLPMIGALAGVVDIDQAATRLVDVGLWSLDVDGWVIHSYAEWQVSKADRELWKTRERERKQRTRRAAKGADSAADVRADTSRTQPGFRAIEQNRTEEDLLLRAAPESDPVDKPTGATRTKTKTTNEDRATTALRLLATRLAVDGQVTRRQQFAAAVVRNAVQLPELDAIARASPELEPEQIVDRFLAANRTPANRPSCTVCGATTHSAAGCMLAEDEETDQ